MSGGKLGIRAKVFTVVVIGAAAALVWLGYRFDRQVGSSANTGLPPAVGSFSPVGTWKGEQGGVLNFRADGSGRSRVLANTQQQITYFEWSLDQRMLTVVIPPTELFAKVHATVFGVRKIEFMLTEIDSEQVDFMNYQSGKLQRFVRTTDSSVDDAP